MTEIVYGHIPYNASTTRKAPSESLKAADT